jgi:hypothetical protein
VGFPRFPQPRHFHSSLVFPPSFRRLQASSSPLRADAGRLVLRGPVGRLCFTDLPCILKRPITCGPYRIDTSPFRCSWIVTVQPASELRNRVLSICHSRSPIATVLSLATTRSVCTVKIQSRSVRPLRRNAVPFAAEATQNLPLNSSMYRFRKNSLACSRSVTPAASAPARSRNFSPTDPALAANTLGSFVLPTPSSPVQPASTAACPPFRPPSASRRNGSSKRRRLRRAFTVYMKEGKQTVLYSTSEACPESRLQ